MIGVLIASTAGPDELTPGSGWWGAGVAVGLLGALWCLAISVVAVTELARRNADRRRAARTLLANVPPVLITPLLIVLAAVE